MGEAIAIEPFRNVSSDPVHVVDIAALNDEEAGYVAAARAANTLRGYRSDWAEWCAWSARQGYPAMPATAEGISCYLTFLAQAGTKVGTMSRRLSGIRFAHRMRDLPDPTATARVTAVWEGHPPHPCRPARGRCPPHAPELFDVIDRCPTTETCADPKRPPEADLAGLARPSPTPRRLRRRSELTALTVDQIAEHPNGLVISIARSKTNQTGQQAELAVLPRARMAALCPVTALQAWLAVAAITDGPVFRSVSTGNRAGTRAMNPASVNVLVQAAAARAGLDPAAYSAHSLRAGFVTYAHLRGASDRAIAHQTRHRSLATLGQYVRVAKAWDDNAATQLDSEYAQAESERP